MAKTASGQEIGKNNTDTGNKHSDKTNVQNCWMRLCLVVLLILMVASSSPLRYSKKNGNVLPMPLQKDSP